MIETNNNGKYEIEMTCKTTQTMQHILGSLHEKSAFMLDHLALRVLEAGWTIRQSNSDRHTCNDV